MRYAASYDIGDRKREQNGINEDSIAISVFQDGHREGYKQGELHQQSGDDKKRKQMYMGPVTGSTMSAPKITVRT